MKKVKKAVLDCQDPCQRPASVQIVSDQFKLNVYLSMATIL